MWLPLLLSACSDYALDGDDKSDPAFDSGDTAGTPTDSVATAEETCNGVDDDGDGLVDEGMPDVDADGVPDCLDGDCTVDAPPPRAEHDATCEHPWASAPAPADPWDIVVEWEVASDGSVSTPAVGDLDRDGIPEVVWVDYAGGGRLVVADGATGAPEWTWSSPEENAGAALGDVDGDGYGDVVVTRGVYGNAHTVHAFDRDGTELWQGRVGLSFYAHPAIADADGDGTAEVLVNEYVLDGATGATEAEMDVSGDSNFGAGFFADLDLDGTAEVLLAEGVFGLDGTRRFDCGAAGEVVHPLVAQLDADPEGEVVTAGLRTITACDDDGTLLWQRGARLYVGSLGAADMDGDGVQELVVPDSDALRLWRADGSEVWSVPVNDASGASGVTLWDVDLDGAPEVFYRDELQLWVVNGATGEVVFELADLPSWTSWETPAVADVDGDGAGEVVVVSCGAAGTSRVLAIGGADGDWPPARPVYNQATFAETNIEDDLSVPIAPRPSWLEPAPVFRGQTSARARRGLPDAEAEVTGVCAASCEEDGVLELWVQVWNDGDAALPASTEVTLYGTVSGVAVPLETRALGAPLDPAASAELAFTTTVAAAGSALVVEVDGALAVAECDEDDNRSVYTDLGCR